MVNISVIIPTHNRKDLLQNCLQALFVQSSPTKDYEILVCDDGSTDGTQKLVKNLIKKQKNLCYFRQKNQGPAAARNLGIKNAKGKIIAFTDDDCLPTKDWLKEIANSFRKNSDALGIEGKTISRKEKDNLLTYSVINNKGGQYWTCNIAYKKKVLEAVGDFDDEFRFSHCEDIDLARRVLDKGKIIFLPEILVVHPPRKTGIFSGLKKLSHLEDEFKLYQKHEDYFSQFFPVKNKLVVFFLMALGNHLWYRMKLIKDSLRTFFQNPSVWFKFLLKNILEALCVIIIFPKALWRTRK